VAVRHKGKGDEQLPDPEKPFDSRDVLVIVGTPEDITRFQAGGGYYPGRGAGEES
jgi:K+/H+ antiporter YhaU regulatory subunit KhtT